MIKYSQARMLWFHKTTALTQSIFTFPIIGYISGYQAIIIFGLGLPILFGIMQYTGQIHYAGGAFVVVVIFSMIRPPVMSYEARILALLKFHMGSKSTKKKTVTKKSTVMETPSTKPGKTIIPKEPEPIEIMKVTVSPGAPIEVAITLRNKTGAILAKRPVHIQLDGTTIKSAMSSSSGQVMILLDHDECNGKRRISICDIKDGDTGDELVSQEIEFVRK